MAYDEDLARRIRELVTGGAGLTEQKMFGGLAFMIGGNMAIGASGQGGALVRCDPEASDELVASSAARLFEMRGRQMKGWLRVDSESLATTEELARWVEIGTTYARSLPAKREGAAVRQPRSSLGLLPRGLRSFVHRDEGGLDDDESTVARGDPVRRGGRLHPEQERSQRLTRPRCTSDAMSVEDQQPRLTGAWRNAA